MLLSLLSINGEIVMARRVPRVYFCEKTQDRNAILIFDAGYDGGDIHIYEHKETQQAKKIENEMKTHFKPHGIPEDFHKDVVQMWVEQKYGNSIVWKLTPE